MSIGLHDCPRCGAKNAAFGDDGFCGKCEVAYAEEQHNQQWWERYHHDPYNDTWGHFHFAMIESQEPAYVDGVINTTILGLYGQKMEDCPEEIKVQILRACVDAKMQRLKSEWNPPVESKQFVPCV